MEGWTFYFKKERNAPEVYAAVIDADRESQRTFSGHGSALAQPYNHVIMPLANKRDKYTQAIWGIRDFQHRFGRDPEGMWTPETAVDLETLETLAELGIRFTILAPRQAKRVKPAKGKDWQDVSNGCIDPTMPYTLRLPSGRNWRSLSSGSPRHRSGSHSGRCNQKLCRKDHVQKETKVQC